MSAYTVEELSGIARTEGSGATKASNLALSSFGTPCKMRLRSLFVLLAWFLSVPVLCAQGLDDPNLQARVEALLEQMTLEEKLGQISQYSGGQPTGPGAGRRQP